MQVAPQGAMKLQAGLCRRRVVNRLCCVCLSFSGSAGGWGLCGSRHFFWCLPLPFYETFPSRTVTPLRTEAPLATCAWLPSTTPARSSW